MARPYQMLVRGTRCPGRRHQHRFLLVPRGQAHLVRTAELNWPILKGHPRQGPGWNLPGLKDQPLELILGRMGRPQVQPDHLRER